MNILANIESSKTLNGELNNVYFNLSVDKKEVSVTVQSGKWNLVNVMVKNASHKAYRGFGKTFKSIDEAIANYSDSKIVAMLEFVKNY